MVHNAVNPPFRQWREAFPAAVDGVLAGAESTGARMVFVDDTWMYGRTTGWMTEDLPYRPVSDKGVLRAWLAERVLAAHESGRVQTVIGRAPELYGPAVESLLGSNIFGPAAHGGLAVWIGDLDQPLTPMFIDDFAHGLAELASVRSARRGVAHPDAGTDHCQAADRPGRQTVAAADARHEDPRAGRPRPGRRVAARSRRCRNALPIPPASRHHHSRTLT